MELGTLAQIIAVLALIGAIGIAVSWVLRVSGLFDLLQVFIGFMSNFLQMIGRLISYAPKGIQVFIFFTVGLAFVGLMTNWVLAADKVCADGNLYQTNSYITGMIAKTLPGDDAAPTGAEGEPINITVETGEDEIGTLETSTQPATNGSAIGVRSEFIGLSGVGPNEQFTRIEPTDEFISYECDPDAPDEVLVGMFGYPVFTPAGIAIISGIFGIFSLMKALNVF
jgi:hypothetical protein